MSEALSQLEKWFGYHAFLGPQESIVERTLAGEELCVVMPTGAGKSICYQLPMLMRGGYGLVVSPLISLMRDQVEALRQRGIGAACVNSLAWLTAFCPVVASSTKSVSWGAPGISR